LATIAALLAEAGSMEEARRLMAEALHTGVWSWTVEELATVCPSTVIVLANELLRTYEQ
jgi:hypothetical protein